MQGEEALFGAPTCQKEFRKTLNIYFEEESEVIAFHFYKSNIIALSFRLPKTLQNQTVLNLSKCHAKLFNIYK